MKMERPCFILRSRGRLRKSTTGVYVTQSCSSSFGICPKIAPDDNLHEKRLETVMLLTNFNLDINKQDKYGRTALHYAAVQVLP